MLLRVVPEQKLTLQPARRSALPTRRSALSNYREFPAPHTFDDAALVVAREPGAHNRR
jgi:hypothetical protein